MKKAFADPTLEPILFGFDVITSSGGGGVVISHKSADLTDDPYSVEQGFDEN